MCTTGKIPYSRDEDAWRVAAKVIEKGRACDLKIHFCRLCRSFHLTTAKVQLHDHFWRDPDKWYYKIKNWFKERGQITDWDSE